MDARNHAGAVAPALNYQDFDPTYDQVIEPQLDTLLLYLPGFAKDQLRVQLTSSGSLKISGQRRLDGDKWIQFTKQFPVSSNCDTNRISAKFESGILYIMQPKLIIPAEKPADLTEEKTNEAPDPNKKPEDSDPGSETGPVEPDKPGNDSEKKGVDRDSKAGPVEPTKPENVSEKKGVDRDSKAGPVEPTKPENGYEKKGVDRDSRTGPVVETKPDNGSDKKAVAGKGAKMTAEMAQLTRSRKMMNVGLVILLVVGIVLYLNNKMRSSSIEAGEL